MACIMIEYFLCDFSPLIASNVVVQLKKCMIVCAGMGGGGDIVLQEKIDRTLIDKVASTV